MLRLNYLAPEPREFGGGGHRNNRLRRSSRSLGPALLLHTCLPLAAMHHHHNLKIAASGQHRLIWGIIICFYRSGTTSGSKHNFAQVTTVPLAANKCAGVPCCLITYQESDLVLLLYRVPPAQQIDTVVDALIYSCIQNATGQLYAPPCIESRHEECH